MRELIHRFASLRVTVVLLVLILVGLSAGTIVESLHGAPAALRLVYGAPWFRALLAVFAANLLCSIVDLWPWGQRRIGYVVTHGSMLVILAGALVTDLAKTEGQLQIWEGEDASAVAAAPAAGSTAPTVVATLPFAVHLDAFEVDYYQGTRMPAQFRSRVTVKDGGHETKATIEMNRELAYGGWRFFQSSYRLAPGKNLTILTASKDPGEPVVFLGYYALVAGMLVVLATRIADRRRAARPLASAAALALALLLPAARATAQTVPPVPSAQEVEELRALPVQHDGRVMPLDTLAREAVFKVTGGRSVWGLDPVATVLGWTFDRQAWAVQPIVPIRDAQLAAAVGLPAGTDWSSFQALAGNARLMELIQAARAADEQERPLAPLEKSAQKLESRLLWLQQFFEREVLRVIPAPRAGDPWAVPDHLRSPADLRAVLASGLSAERLSAEAAAREITHNRARPTRTAWLVLVLALVLSIVAWNVPRRGLDLAAFAALLAGFAVMSWGIWTRWQIAGHIPASNMYESLLFLAWGVGAFALVASLFLRNRMVILNAAAMSALTMALTDLLPIDPFVHPMPPVLSGTYWLAVHVPIIMVGYAVLALGVVVAHMQLGFEAFAPARRSAALLMTDLLYWYTMAGSILLIAGILTGSMWASSSWGRYWGWDPKEVWSLVAFLAYMAILHARTERLLGRFGIAAWSIVAFQAILMTYLGVNFVLSSGLHSYGFGESNVVRAMVAVAVAEAAFIGFAWARQKNAQVA
ncbi:MAG TPA: cytochrome c biogenesis protein CcsA [Vicinamibacteria bacterium]|nr:cytochrome c biogenesis protein CcsA [Vicinamibacteria bacterium]